MQTCEVTPQQIVLELTETFLVKDPEIAVLRLEELRRLGVGVAVDDFGTGYTRSPTCGSSRSTRSRSTSRSSRTSASLGRTRRSWPP